MAHGIFESARPGFCNFLAPREATQKSASLGGRQEGSRGSRRPAYPRERKSPAAAMSGRCRTQGGVKIEELRCRDDWRD